MATIKFLTDYRGVLSKEEFFRAGAVVDVDYATALVNAGRAEYVNPEPGEADLLALNDQQLKDMAKTAGIKNYWSMSRATLLLKLIPYLDDEEE